MEPVVVIIGVAVALALVMRLFGGGSVRRAGRRRGMVDDGDGGDGGDGGGDGGGGD